MLDSKDKLPEVMDLRTVRRYVAVSLSTLNKWISDPADPLPAHRIGNKLYVRRAAFDQWIDRRRVKVQDLGALVDQTLRELR